MEQYFDQKLIASKTEAEKNMESLREDLKLFSSIDSFSGQESKLRDHIKDVLERLEISCEVDEKGNLWTVSKKENQKDILLCAHLDKVGSGNEAVFEDGRTKGRLDDSLGLSVILQIVRQGYRPSLLFTVEEESQIEVEKDGKVSLEERDLPNGIYNAGARYAAEHLEARNDKPKLVVVIDVSTAGRLGEGPLVYTSSGLKKPGKQFYFPTEELKNVAKIINPNKPGVSYVEGNANDAIEFTFVPDMGVIAVEVPIENYHTSREEADLGDVEKTVEIVRRIMENSDKIHSSESGD